MDADVEGGGNSGSGESSCGVDGAAAGALQTAGRQAASSVVAVGSAAQVAARLSMLPVSAAVHGGAAAMASAAAPGAAVATSALAGALRVERRIRLRLVSVMLLLVWLPNQVLIVVLTTKVVALQQCEDRAFWGWVFFPPCFFWGGGPAAHLCGVKACGWRGRMEPGGVSAA